MSKEATAITLTAERIATPEAVLEGDLSVPPRALGIVLFAHGSGSGRFSPRNRQVAAALQKAGFATLLMDLLTRSEEAVDEATGHLRFDVERLAARLVAATEWLATKDVTKMLPVGYFGASTGAAAALIAAAKLRQTLRAIVSRGGRPDLALWHLKDVKAPTLLIVGGLDDAVIGLNKVALESLKGVKEMRIVPGATHLFEEPGKLEEVERLAAAWFKLHLPIP